MLRKSVIGSSRAKPKSLEKNVFIFCCWFSDVVSFVRSVLLLLLLLLILISLKSINCWDKSVCMGERKVNLPDFSVPVSANLEGCRKMR